METMLLQSGCRILYGMHAVDVVMDGAAIDSVVCYSKSGRCEIKARIFIDATGDGDIAAAAGAPVRRRQRRVYGVNLGAYDGHTDVKTSIWQNTARRISSGLKATVTPERWGWPAQ
jgi:flavin-dependent dehydrogenase